MQSFTWIQIMLYHWVKWSFKQLLLLIIINIFSIHFFYLMMHQRNLIIFLFNNLSLLNYFLDLTLSILIIINFAIHYVIDEIHALSTSLLISVFIDCIKWYNVKRNFIMNYFIVLDTFFSYDHSLFIHSSFNKIDS